MTKYNILIFSFFPLFVFAECADCEAYKTQVSSDCDSIISSCDSAYWDCLTAGGTAEEFAVYYASNTTESVALTHAAEYAFSAAGTITTLKTFAQSIKSTVQSLQCTTNNSSVSCDCAPYLQSLVTLVTSAKNELAAISATLGTVQGKTVSGLLDLIESTNQDLVDILTEFLLWDGGDSLPITIQDFYNVFTAFSSITNKSYRLNPGMYNSISYQRMITSGKTSQITQTSSVGYAYPFNKDNSWVNASLTDILWGGFYNEQFMLASLNNYAYTNYIELVRTRQYLQSIDTNLVSLSEKFSIFNDFVFSSDAPLSMYTDIATDGSYHDFLTNYYIKVSRGQQSGSDPFTNWFSRIEILLASLVFRDDGTNFVDEAENTSQMENTLSQSVDTLSQAVALPQNVTGKIDNMGQSFLGLLGEWRTIVSGNSLPSQFVLCDINLGSQGRDSSAGSSVSSFRLETSLDSGEFRQFLDFCHAITTILFTMLFVWLSMMLLSFLLASLAKLAHFCYTVYSALFGG